MPNTHTWSIASLECNPHKKSRDATLDKVVCAIHWYRNATDGTHSSSTYGVQNIDLNPDASFIPFDSLTQSTIEGWLEAAMGVQRIADIDAALDREVAEKASPSVVSMTPPWAANLDPATLVADAANETKGTI